MKVHAIGGVGYEGRNAAIFQCFNVVLPVAKVPRKRLLVSVFNLVSISRPRWDTGEHPRPPCPCFRPAMQTFIGRALVVQQHQFDTLGLVDEALDGLRRKLSVSPESA